MGADVLFLVMVELLGTDDVSGEIKTRKKSSWTAAALGCI
jgi:hypothetical protein